MEVEAEKLIQTTGLNHQSKYQGGAVPGAGQEPLLARVVHRGQDVDRNEGREVGRQVADRNSLRHCRHEWEHGLKEEIVYVFLSIGKAQMHLFIYLVQISFRHIYHMYHKIKSHLAFHNCAKQF